MGTVLGAVAHLADMWIVKYISMLGKDYRCSLVVALGMDIVGGRIS